MAFTFEALPARYGDSLFLTFEDPSRKLRLLIDGGPSRVYETSLRPRLVQEAKGLSGDDQLVLDAVMVSHIDEDHIKGVLELLGELRDADEAQMRRPWDVRWLLHNSFDALLDESEGAAARAVGGATVLAGLGGAAALSELLEDRELNHTTELVLASYGQGSQLASLAAALQISRNPPDGSPIMSVAGGPRVLKLGTATLTIVGPRASELEKLRKAWLKWRAEQKDKKTPTKALAATLDESVPNLSSIVALVEHGGKTALITGDARADYVYDGLKEAKLLKSGKLHVDILKLPHHGSVRNMTPDFLKKVTADHYVASGDGTYGNPDRATLEMLAKARPDGGYTVHITHDGPTCDRIHEEWRRDRKGPKFDAETDGIVPVLAAWEKAGLIQVNVPTAKVPQITIRL